MPSGFGGSYSRDIYLRSYPFLWLSFENSFLRRIFESTIENHTIYSEKHLIIETLHKLWNSVALIRKRTIPTERPPVVGEVSVKFCG
jgi:hypothetical protein